MPDLRIEAQPDRTLSAALLASTVAVALMSRFDVAMAL